VELVLREITDCIERGETVKLSSFGSFVVRKKSQRMGRNPKTGKEAPISPRRVMVFKPSAILKQRINSAAKGKVSPATTALLDDAPMPARRPRPDKGHECIERCRTAALGHASNKNRLSMGASRPGRRVRGSVPV
jgi:integration host factor subunit alpha